MENFQDAKSTRMKERAVILHIEKDNEVKRSARRNYRRYMEQLVEDAQVTAESNDMKTV